MLDLNSDNFDEHCPAQSNSPPAVLDGAAGVRNVSVRTYLPDRPILQDLVPPTLEDGWMHTLAAFLTTRLPLLFPPPESGKPTLAYAVIQPGVHPAGRRRAF
ncbi:hypothetical protein BN946_scf184512.g2 [Trametes cinnabarina]|uniref:Autophagy protein ATG5 UblB domain-containing protein n=1 Tax=Pycnoporus cinnabarinus TaxID=5643 RepID=A0A060ST06_PYCCI|nr:hypothetical protein BN946_scf184512.g2 [Trametes cinnabarina]